MPLFAVASQQFIGDIAAMLILCDNPTYAGSYFSGNRLDDASIDSNLTPLSQELFGEIKPHGINCLDLAGWKYGFISEQALRSQYDIVCDLARQNITIPDGTFCAAGSGAKFHGQRNRSWLSPPGNIYLTTHFAPHRKIEGFGVAFPILAAVSVVETIDTIPGLAGRAGIKWVNDIFLEDNKVSGFLACNHNVDSVVSSVTLGIGLNVQTAPDIEPTPFVPGATCLQKYFRREQAVSPQQVLPVLLKTLWRNYELILAGHYRQLLNIYRKRSIIIGRDVEVISDPHDSNTTGDVIASGRIVRIGDNLELYLENQTEPIIHGRLILKDKS
ncbi:MAG: hypothetical protein R3F48_17830 [Candidatus Zixiibacteriota bacterium]